MNWNCSSIDSPSLPISSKMQSPSINFLQQHGLSFKKSKPTFSTHSQEKLQFLPKLLPIQLKRFPPISCFSHIPNEHSLTTRRSCTTPKNILDGTAEKIAISLVGGLIFIASFGSKPAVALQSLPKSSLSETMVEKKDTKSDDIDDEMYMKLLEKNPRDVDTLKMVLSKNMSYGNAKDALKYVERLIEIEPDEVEWRLLHALSYEMMGQLSKAKSLFREILEETPLLLRALHGLAMVMHKNLEGPAVFEMLQKALDLAKREKRVTEERNIKILTAQMHVVKGELEDGLKKFHDLIDENPRDFRPYLCQGIIYSLMDKKKEAEEQFETYRSLVPEEFPQRGFLDDVVLAARTESGDQLAKELDTELSYKK